jgi:uncharacterized cupredoxin-like copper-binding protein
VSWLRRIATGAVVAVAVAGAGFVVDAAGSAEDPLGPGTVTVEMWIQHSKFSVGHIEVEPGTLVQFEVRNDDPIDHELVVGDEDVHARHSTGTEPRHPPVPGEVSVAAETTGSTFYVFDEPGAMVFACHLPGHVEYGMTGEIEVVDKR